MTDAGLTPYLYSDDSKADQTKDGGYGGPADAEYPQDKQQANRPDANTSGASGEKDRVSICFGESHGSGYTDLRFVSRKAGDEKDEDGHKNLGRKRSHVLGGDLPLLNEPLSQII